tara:strand:- start:3062 stop:3640 length:579 start_codon:yes stop_codon:yes gene_type:complete
MDCFDGYTAFSNQYYLTTNVEEMNNTQIDQCKSYCSNSFSCGGFNFLHKNSQCILLITDNISLSRIQQRAYSIFYMQSYNVCDDNYFLISPFYLVFMIIVILILGICCWSSCFRNNNRLRLHQAIYRHTDSHTHLIDSHSLHPVQIPPPYQATIVDPEREPVMNVDLETDSQIQLLATPPSIPNSPPPPIEN